MLQKDTCNCSRSSLINQPMHTFARFVIASFAAATTSALNLQPADDWHSAITGATMGAVITLSVGEFIGECDLLLTKNITLQGAGRESTSIKCQEGRHLQIRGPGAHVHLVGIAFAGGRSEDGGGCILAEDGAVLSIFDSSFTECSSGIGGAILARNSAVELAKVDFEGVNATVGGALSLHSATLTASECSFRGCGAGSGGGAIAAADWSSIAVRSSTFYENFAGDDGGAVLGEANTTIVLDDVEFVRNEAGGNGGAIKCVSGCAMELSRATVTNNTCGLLGGAIYLLHFSTLQAHNQIVFHYNLAAVGGGVIYAEDSCDLDIGGNIEIVGNVAQAGWGGGIHHFLTGTLKIHDNVLCKHNYAEFRGGCFHADNGIEVSLWGGVSLISNHAVQRAGGCSVMMSNVHLWGGVEIRDNTSPIYTGGLYIALGVIDAREGVYFSGNHAMFYSAILCFVCTGFFEGRDVVFHDNVATYQGAAFGILYPSVVTIDGAVLRHNNATLDKGGAIIVATDSHLTLRHAWFEGNVALVSGGAVQCMAASTEVFNTTFVGNRAGTGAAVTVFDGQAQLSHSHFDDNGFQEGHGGLGDGGAVSLKDSSVQVDSCVIERGKASSVGGGISVRSSTLTVTDTRFEGCQAPMGGALVAFETSTLDIESVTVTECEAETNGGGISVYENSKLHVSGRTLLKGNVARELGGGIFIQESEMTFAGESLVVWDNTAGISGGGLSYLSSVVLESGVSLFKGNKARVGGGLCGTGGLAEVVIGDGHAMSVEGCEAEVDGGGIALLEMAKLTYDPEHCPESCVWVAKEDVADNCLETTMHCMKRGCNWNFGECNVFFENVTNDGDQPCDRALGTCDIVSERHPTVFAPECFKPSCDWSETSPVTVSFRDDFSVCPLFDAVVLESLLRQPKGLKFVTEGGPAVGYGRCVDSTCHPPETRPEIEPWCAAEQGCNVTDPDASWCEVIDDNSRAIRQVIWLGPGTDFGLGWGVCQEHEEEHPLLPGSGLSYDKQQLLSILDLPMHELFERYPACGVKPLTLRANKAGRFGGGAYKSSCDTLQEQAGACFVGGFKGTFLPSMIMDMSDNEAGAGGGAVFLNCNNMDACRPLLEGTLGLPKLLDQTTNVLSFEHNLASFGPDFATAVLAIDVLALQASFVPGRGALNVTLALVDAMQQRMIGTVSNPLPYLISARVCLPSAAACAESDLLLQPSAFFKPAPQRDQLSTILNPMTLVQCPVDGEQRVRVTLSVSGQEQIATSVAVACLPCEAGQSLVHSMLGDVKMWSCQQCASNEYVLDPNNENFQCQACPVGARCENGQLYGLLNGSVWEGDYDHGIYRLVECPKGTQRTTTDILGQFAHDSQTCRECLPGEYIAEPNLGTCEACPKGARCDDGLCALGDGHDHPSCAGGEQIVGTWEWDRATNVYHVTGCPAGYQLVNSVNGEFAVEQQQCLKCERGQYIVNSTRHECRECPVGGECDGSVLVGAVAGSVWETDDEAGIYRLTRCPRGHILVRDINPMLDECVACRPGKYSVVEAVYPDVLTTASSLATADLCVDCPPGAECVGGNTIIPSEGFWMLDTDRARTVSARRHHSHAEQLNESMVFVYACPKDACLTGGECAEGRIGPVCALCEEGRALSGTTCMECKDFDSSEYQYSALGVIVVIVLVIWYLVSWRSFFAPDEPETPTNAAEERKNCPSCYYDIENWVQEKVDRVLVFYCDSPVLAYLKIFISFWQVVSTFEFTFNIEWPLHITKIWEYASVLSFDFFDIPGPNCIGQLWGYLRTLQAFTVTPLLFSILLWWPSLILVLKGLRHTSRFKRVDDAFWFALLFWLFLVYPTVSLRCVQGFKCRLIGGENYLEADMTLACPSDDKTSMIFIWSAISTILFPIGIPIFILFSLRRFKIPQLAKTKKDNAVLQAMLACYKNHFSQTITAKIAEYLGGGQSLMQDEEGVMIERARVMFNGATENGTVELTSDRLLAYLDKIDLHGEDQEEVHDLFLFFDQDGNGTIDWEEFWDMVLSIEEKEGRIHGHETIENISDDNVEDLCRFGWAHLKGDDDMDGEATGLKREIKKKVKKKMQNAQNALQPTSSSGNDLESFARLPTDGSAKFNMNQRLNQRYKSAKKMPQTEEEEAEEEGACPLPEDATKSEKLAWLLGEGRTLIWQGSLAIPVVKWDGATQEERDAIDKVGFLFDSYKVEYWYYELIEMGRKFVMTGLVVFMWPDSPEQVAAAIIVTVISLFYFMTIKPFTSASVDMMQSISLVTQAATLFYGLMLTVDRIQGVSSEGGYIGYVVMALNLIIFVVPVLTLLFGELENIKQGIYAFKRKMRPVILRMLGKAPAAVEGDDPASLEPTLSDEKQDLQRAASHRLDRRGMHLKRAGTTRMASLRVGSTRFKGFEKAASMRAASIRKTATGVKAAANARNRNIELPAPVVIPLSPAELAGLDLQDDSATLSEPPLPYPQLPLSSLNSPDEITPDDESRPQSDSVQSAGVFAPASSSSRANSGDLKERAASGLSASLVHASSVGVARSTNAGVL